MKVFVTLSLLTRSLFADMSIKEAWQDADLHNEGLKASSSSVTRAELKKSSAESMYLPSISLTGSYTHLSEPVTIDTSGLTLAFSAVGVPFPSELEFSKQDVFMADLQMLWPLYVGGKIDAAQDIYTAKISEQKALKEMKKDKEFLKLIKYYYGVVVSESLYKTRLEAQKALTIHYQNAKKLKEQGQIAEVELLNARVKLDTANIDLTKAKHKLEIASSALLSLTKQKGNPSSKLFVNEQMREEEYYKNQTKKNYAGLKVFDAKSAQSASLIEIQEAAWKPEVAAFGNVNLYKDDSAIMESLPKWFAGVSVKINILQREDRAQEIEAAKLLHNRVKYLKLEALDNLTLLVEKTYKEMLSDAEEFNALSSSLALAKENFRLRKVAFKEGLSTSVELVDAEMSLLGAKTSRLNAAYNFVQKLSQLSVLSGDREMFFSVEELSEEIE